MNTPASSLLHALADPTRCALFESLAQRPQTVGEVAAPLPVSRSAVSQHLKVLREAGLVEGRRAGREVVYAASAEALVTLAAHFRALGDHAGLPPDDADEHDHVDQALQRWRELWPEYDTATVALIARLLLIGRLMDRLTGRTAAHHGISRVDIIVLGTLRRIGPPHESTATELSKTAVLSLPGMSQRLDHLERRGLVKRLPSPQDGRASVVRLTAKGIALNDRVVREQMGENFTAFFELPQTERAQLARSLRRVLRRLEA
jgi:DNA-binding MarR family transcriptional regulator